MIFLLRTFGLRLISAVGGWRNLLIGAGIAAVAAGGWWILDELGDRQERIAILEIERGQAQRAADGARKALEDLREEHARALEEIARVAAQRDAERERLDRIRDRVAADAGSERDGPIAPVILDGLKSLAERRSE